MREWLKRIFYMPKHSKPTDENIMRLLLPSFLGIVLCMVCLAGSTWAWFSASISTSPQTIEAANFDIAVTVNGKPVSSPVTLEAGQQYTVTLTAIGNAPSGGYCEVESGAVFLYTETILPNELLAFTLIPDSNAAYTFTAVWGKYSGKADITNGCTIGAEQPETGDETPSEQANPVTENVSADDSPTVSQPADTPAATGSGDTEPAVPPTSPESTEPTGSEPPEPDFSETDETNESQSTQAPAE